MTPKNIGMLVLAALLGAATVVAVTMFREDDQVSAPVLEEIQAERTIPLPAENAEDVTPAPDFALPTLEGETFSLTDHRGQVVVVNFWATWCAPCRIEIPDLIQMQDDLEDDGVQFVGVSLDFGGEEVVRDYADDVDFNYPIVMDTGDLANAFGGIYALPTTIIIDRDGLIRRRIPGLVTRNLLTPILEELAAG